MRNEITSKKTNNRMVLGPRRLNAGVHPLNRNMTPSSRSERLRIPTMPMLPDFLVAEAVK
jgi:hypothetical protein